MPSQTALMLRIAFPVWLALTSNLLFAEWSLDIEVGVFKAARNDVQIPNDEQGDEFDITDIGNDAFPAGRLKLAWLPAEEHELQLIYAPFSYSEKGAFNENVRFAGTEFSSGPVKARYEFSNYRLRYLYHWIENARWSVDIGATLFVRDASIKLTQGGVSTEDDNVGLVPLLAFRSAYTVSPQWKMYLDSDFAVAPQGRAIDLALLAEYRLSPQWTVAGGYRTIEGGVDNNDTYSFAWFHGAVLKVGYSW